MFEKVLFRPHAIKLPINLGQIMESLFFYQETIVHVGRSELTSLINSLDNDSIVELLNRPELQMQYKLGVPGVKPNGNAMEFSLNSFFLSNFELDKELYRICNDATKDQARSKDFAERISQIMSLHELPPGFTDVFDSELADEQYRNNVIFQTIAENNPGHGLVVSSIRSDIQQIGTDIMGAKIYRMNVNLNPNTYNFTGEQVALNAIVGTTNIQAASEIGAEIIVPEMQSGILRAKINHLISLTDGSQKNIDQFNEFIYDEFDLRTVVNNGKELKDFFKVLDQAAKYKEWLSDIPTDKKLLREYVEKNKEKHWISSNLAKSIRFYLFNGTGAIVAAAATPPLSMAVGLGMSIFNSFVLERLFKKWSPNQFIEKKLLPVVNAK